MASSDPRPASSDVPSSSDSLLRFLIGGAGVRGVHVRLDDSWRQIRARAARDFDQPVALRLLGEATAAAALFTGHAKIEGRLSVQLRSGPLRMLFAECTSDGSLRGTFKLDEHAETVSSDLRAIGEDTMLAITIENPPVGSRGPMRYQGVVAVDGPSLAGAFEGYFAQSEQLPTRLLLAADPERCAGLMLQKLPGDGGDADGWTRACALFDTLSTAELLELPAETLLSRVFHEDGVQALGHKPLQFGCSCSRERVEAVLVSLGREEALAAAADGVASIQCEFCGQNYRLDTAEIQQLLATAEAAMPPPERMQ